MNDQISNFFFVQNPRPVPILYKKIPILVISSVRDSIHLNNHIDYIFWILLVYKVKINSSNVIIYYLFS